MATDPICGMYVDERSSPLSLVRENRTYYFCSHSCLSQFSAPEAGLARLRRRLLVAWPLAVLVVVVTYLWRPTGAGWVAFGAATVVQVYSAGPFYQGLVDAVRGRMGNMDVLIATGTTAAYLYSAAVLLVPGRLPPAVYFDASTLIVALILSGSYLEHLTRHRAGGALRRLREELPARAARIEGDTETRVALSDLKVGDLVRVRPGERIPADGEVVRGRTSVAEALLTGESTPQEKGPGSLVIGGTVNGDGLIDVRTLRVGADSTLEQIGALLTQAELSRIPLQRLADRLAAGFVPFVLVLAVAAAVAWALIEGSAHPGLVVLVFVSVVITACPCAFGIATPAALLVGTGRAAEEGVWFKDRDAIEQGAMVTTVLTDKTGTLTGGRPNLVEVWTPDSAGTGEALATAAALEQGSEHPLARAVVEAASRLGPSLPKVGRLRALPGEGVEGEIGGEAVSIRRASLSLTELDGNWQEGVRRLEETGRTVSVLLVGGRPRALFAFDDPVSPTAREGVAALMSDRIPVVMATGDRQGPAVRVARQVGIDAVHSGLSPAGKVALVREYQSRGHRVAFVGDGINDAPVLVAADLGIAIGSATDVAREAGGIVLTRADFREVAFALRLCRQTVRRVRQNLGWAVGYNLVLLPLAAGALVPFFGLGVYAVLPIVGAAAMGLSSTTVLLNSLSLRWASLQTTPRGGVRPLPS